MLTVDMRGLREALLACISANIPAMIWGPPGIGKSKLVYQIAEALGAEEKEPFGFVDFRANLRDPVDARGLPAVDIKKGTARWLPPSELPQEKRDGKRGIFFADELPQASMAMQTAMFGLILDRKLGEYKMPDGWVPIAAGNRRGDRSGAQMMPRALCNRFAHFEVAADIKSWTAWAAKANVHPMVMAFLRFREDLLHMMPEGDENSFPTPRSWEQVSKISDVRDKTLRRNLAQSMVGEGAAAEFEGYFRIWEGIPDIDQIFRDPQAARVPDATEVATLFAVASALGRRVKKENLSAAFEYAKRMPKEFEIIVAVDAIRRDTTLKDTKAFGKWFVENSSVLI